MQRNKKFPLYTYHNSTFHEYTTSKMNFKTDGSRPFIINDATFDL